MKKVCMILISLLLLQCHLVFAEMESEEDDTCIFQFVIEDTNGQAIPLKNVKYVFQYRDKISTNVEGVSPSDFSPIHHFDTTFDQTTNKSMRFIGEKDTTVLYRIYGQVGDGYYYFEGETVNDKNQSLFKVNLSLNDLNKVTFTTPTFDVNHSVVKLCLIPEYTEFEMNPKADMAFTCDISKGTVDTWIPEHYYLPIVFTEEQNNVNVYQMNDEDVYKSEKISLKVKNDNLKKSTVSFPEVFDSFVLVLRDDQDIKWSTRIPIYSYKNTTVTYYTDMTLSLSPNIEAYEDQLFPRRYELIPQLNVGTFYYMKEIINDDKCNSFDRYVFQDDQGNHFRTMPWLFHERHVEVQYNTPQSKSSLDVSSYDFDVFHLQDPFYNGKTTFMSYGEGKVKLKSQQSADLEKCMDAKVQGKNLVVSGQLKNVTDSHHFYVVYWNTNTSKECLGYVSLFPFQSRSFSFKKDLSNDRSGFVSIEYNGIMFKRITIK